jgi:hypothetical protein
MADYHSPTVVCPCIPRADMTDIEHLLLTNVFESEPDGDALYFFAEDYINDMPVMAIDDVRTALAASADCSTAAYVRDQLAQIAQDDAYLQLEAEIPWDLAFQDIVQRSASVEHVEVITSFTCTKMRPDGFGGAITVITRTAILSASTEQMAGELLDRAQYGELGCAPGFGSHVALRLDEAEVRSTLGEIFETDAQAGVAIEDVTDADIRAACLAVLEHRDLSHEKGEAIFSAAMRAIRIAADRRRAA